MSQLYCITYADVNRRKVRGEQASHLPLLQHEGNHKVNDSQEANAKAFGGEVLDMSGLNWHLKEI